MTGQQNKQTVNYHYWTLAICLFTQQYVNINLMHLRQTKTDQCTNWLQHFSLYKYWDWPELKLVIVYRYKASLIVSVNTF